MNRSSKGFGLAGVLATVVFLIVAAIFSASAKSQAVNPCSASVVACSTPLNQPSR